MWKETAAETHKSAIEQDILRTFGGLPLAQIDKVMLQIHLNDLAKRLSEGAELSALSTFGRFTVT